MGKIAYMHLEAFFVFSGCRGYWDYWGRSDETRTKENHQIRFWVKDFDTLDRNGWEEWCEGMASKN